MGPAEWHELAPLAGEQGARFVCQSVGAVDTDAHVVELDDGSELEYDQLVVCAGGRYKPAFDEATTFPSGGRELYRADEVLDRAAGKDHRMAFVVPYGVTWSLPLYEIALMTQRRAADRMLDVKIAIVTPESAPLAVFGPAASAVCRRVARRPWNRLLPELHRARARRWLESSSVPAIGQLGPAEVVALPADGGTGDPAACPLMTRASSRSTITPESEVSKTSHAAGDGTTFPIKQGGLATQQADAAAEDIAHQLGAAVEPQPFRPMLRGKLLTGDESVNLRTDLAGGGGEGQASPDILWWPPHKISARYLAPFLDRGEVHEEPEPPRRSLDVEVAFPKEWHEEPMALDPYEPPNVK